MLATAYGWTVRDIDRLTFHQATEFVKRIARDRAREAGRSDAGSRPLQNYPREKGRTLRRPTGE